MSPAALPAPPLASAATIVRRSVKEQKSSVLETFKEQLKRQQEERDEREREKRRRIDLGIARA